MKKYYFDERIIELLVNMFRSNTFESFDQPDRDFDERIDFPDGNYMYYVKKDSSGWHVNDIQTFLLVKELERELATKEKLN